MDQLVKRYLAAQNLTIFPQNSFGDAVAQFVDKDDKHAMEEFVKESLESQQKHLLNTGHDDDEDEVGDLKDEMARLRDKQDEDFAKGTRKKVRNRKLKPKPDNWDSDMDGEWSDQPGAHIFGEDEDDDAHDSPKAAPAKKPAARGKAAATGTTRKAAAPATKKAPAAKGGRGKKQVVEESEEEEEADIVMLDDDDDDEESDENALFTRPTRPAARKPAPAKATPAKKAAPSRTKQSTLNFASQASTQRSQPARGAQKKKMQEPSDDEISDDEDAFEPAVTRSTRARR